MAQKQEVSEAPLFGPPANTDRYDPGVRDGGSKPWDVRDELLMFPLLAACQSQTAEDETRRWLCETLGRAPRRAGKGRTADVRAGYRSVISNRLVTRYFTGTAPNWPLMQKVADACFVGARTGQPLTWAEYFTFYMGHKRRGDQDGVATVPLTALLRFLDRGPRDVAAFQRAPVPPDLGTVASEGGHGRPLRAENRPHVESAARWLRECDLGDIRQFRIFWRNLWVVAST